MRNEHNVFPEWIGYPGPSDEFYATLRSCGASEKTEKMKSLDVASMENIQGGSAGNIAINLPIAGLLSLLGIGSFGAGIGLGISYRIDLLPSSLPGL